MVWVEFVVILCIAQLVQATYNATYRETFANATLKINTTSVTQQAIDFAVQFVVTRDIPPEEYIAVRLPRFSQRFQNSSIASSENITVSSLIVAPSYYFTGEWVEYANVMGRTGDGFLPMRHSMLLIKSAINATIKSDSTVYLKVFKENGIGPLCGFAGSSVSTYRVVPPSDPFEIFTIYDAELTFRIYNATLNSTSNVHRNASFPYNTSTLFTTWPTVGPGCRRASNCNGHGACDYCFETCSCQDGYGSTIDVLATGTSPSVDCSQRVCPAGKAIGDIPSSTDTAHSLAECSNQGICDRETGVCKCFAPFTGSACERLACPNNCSGHGQCVSMNDLSIMQRQSKLQVLDFEYGSANALTTTAWDHHTMYGCVCDSAWSVGFQSGERQLGEYFGPDCSLRRCPSGDDPFTEPNEEDCHGLTQLPGVKYIRGMPGNKCHVDCARRGICDHSNGRCTCFEGSWGDACDLIANNGDGRAGFFQAKNGTLYATYDGN